MSHIEGIYPLSALSMLIFSSSSFALRRERHNGHLPQTQSAQGGIGVPGGSGYTGFFFGLIESKHTKTLFPLSSAGT